MFRCFAFFHTKGNTKENILYDVKNIVDVPIIVMLLFGKGGGIQKEEEGGGEINKERNYNPELFGIIYKKDRWVLDLSIQEYKAVNDDQDGFYRCGQGVKIGRLVMYQIGDHHGKKC